MRGAFVALLLVFGLFVFGCTGQANTQTNASANGTTQPSGGSQGPSGGTPSTPPSPPSGGVSGNETMNGSANVTTGGSGTTSGGTTGTASGGSTSGGTSAQVDTSGKDYAGLLALGVPLSCTVTTENGSVTMFMNGQGVTRVEVPSTSSDSTCQETVMLMQGSKIDMSCAQGTMMGGNQGPFAGCDWIEMTFNASATAGSAGASSTGGSEASSVQSAPAAQFSCQPWVPDASKFVTSGKVCNLDQIMKQISGGTGGYPGY